MWMIYFFQIVVKYVSRTSADIDLVNLTTTKCINSKNKMIRTDHTNHSYDIN